MKDNEEDGSFWCQAFEEGAYDGSELTVRAGMSPTIHLSPQAFTFPLP